MVRAVILNEEGKFDKAFINFFKNNVKNMKLTRSTVYNADYIGTVSGKGYCIYETEMSGESYKEHEDVCVEGVPFKHTEMSPSPITSYDLPSNVGSSEIYSAVKAKINSTRLVLAGTLTIDPVRTSSVHVESVDKYTSYKYSVSFTYNNKKEMLWTYSMLALIIYTTYVSKEYKTTEINAKIAGIAFPILLALTGFALYVFAAMDFCSRGSILRVIAAIAYAMLLAYPYMYLLLSLGLYLECSINWRRAKDILILILIIITIAGLFVLTGWLGFCL